MNFELKNKLIVVVANEPWGDIWYSKHNYAYELSKSNTVVFIDPAPSWRLSAAFKKPELTNIEGSLFVLNYFNLLPLITQGVSKFNNRRCSIKIKDFLCKHFSKEIDVFWTFDPHRFFDPRLFSAKRSVFHVVDKYDFKFFGEKSLAVKSDLIVVVSKSFEKQYSDLNKNIIHIPHGISSSQFESSLPVDLDYDGIYVGNIDERVNFKLLEKMLLQFPLIRFLFIGNFYSHDDALAKSIFIEKKYPNLIWLGIKPFNELKNYISKARFCLSIMDPSYPGNDIAHHKTLQYLAFGKPIFGSIFKDYSNIGDMIYQSNDNAEVLQLMSNYFANNEPAELKTKRIAYAAQFTYDKHILKIENALNALHK